MTFGKYQKFIVALVAAAVAVLGAVATGADIVTIVTVGLTTLAGALGVYQVPNKGV